MHDKQVCHIAASIICGNILNLKKNIKLLEKSRVEYIHFDVMDGIFVPRYGLYPEILQTIRSLTSIPIDVHLMVQNPEPYIPLLIQSGGNIIAVHVETCPHLHRTLKIIRRHGGQPGIVINPTTPLDTIDRVIDNISMVMLMAINPGITGQKMIPGSLKKIKKLKKKLKNHPNVLIGVDGGVNNETAPQMVKAGANMLVCGSSTIFKGDIPLDQKTKQLKKLINS